MPFGYTESSRSIQIFFFYIYGKDIRKEVYLDRHRREET